jgi:hypothetical protein
MSLAVFDRLSTLLIMKSWFMYLQISWRPHTSSTGFSTKHYLDLTAQTVRTVVAYKHLSTYLQKGIKDISAQGIRSKSRIDWRAHLAVCAFGCRSVGIANPLTCALGCRAFYWRAFCWMFRVRVFVFCSRPCYTLHVTCKGPIQFLCSNNNIVV